MSIVILFREDFLAKNVDIIYEIQQKMYEQAKTFFTREVLPLYGNHLVKKLLPCKLIWTSYIAICPIREKKIILNKRKSQKSIEVLGLLV